ncbi:MAG: TonB-dependent receptor [Luteimonas sp.]
MKHSHIRFSKLTLGLVIALAAAPVFAQSTSAGVGGVVTSADGQPVVGAEVTITHVESGTVSRANTDASGRYIARGLRVGGPYSITINKAGAGTDTEENIYLALSQVNTVDATLKNDVTTLATVQAVAAAGSEIFSANKMGTGTNVSREQIESLPSANRNIQDYIRLDPRIAQVSKADGAISAGGQNTRYNAIRIDGVSAGDPFGLEPNNLPTERQPVSIDAIEAINIDLANYDTTITGGTGAVIDAVTKSGTNEFHGSVYYAYRDKDMIRKDLRGVEFNGFNDERTYGGTFGGPIIKDKLFFFANYEKYVRSSPGTGLSETPYGKGFITDGDITAIQNAAKTYGFEAGSLSLPASSKTETEEKAIKLDWNINENHRAALRYNKFEQSVLRFPLIDKSRVSLSSSWYALPKTYETIVGELFSDWSDNFSTEFKVAHKKYDAIRTPFSNLPQIQIKGFGPNSDSVYLGTEQNTHVNIIGTKETSFFGAATWYAGDHTVKGGVDYSKSDILNFYGRNLNGAYVFNNVADFQSNAPASYVVRAPRPNGGSYADIPAEYTLKNTGVFLQDTWAINYNLNVSFGVRVDIPDFSEQKLFNPLIQQTYGYDNTNTVDSKLVQPRLGFNYTFDSDRPTQLRGGIGLFGGAAPNVWIAGSYQNTGLNYVEYTVKTPADLAGRFTPGINPPYIPSTGTDPACVPVATKASCPRANVDIVEPGLKMPSVWKTNLAFDHELPWYGIVASAELLLTDVKDALYIERLDLFDGNGNGATAIGQDGRPIFWNANGLNPNNSDRFGMTDGKKGAGTKNYRPNGIGDVMLMRNTSKGKTNQLTVSLSKPMTSDWAWSAAYTHTTASEVSPLTSSQNTSNWGNTLIGTANENASYNSRYAIKDRFTGTLNWQHKFFGDNKTSVGVFYEGRSGRPFSYIFFNDTNGDGANTNDLFYVPNGPGDVKFTGGVAMEQSFFAWLDQHPELKRFQGQIAPANEFNAKWVNNFDVHVAQEIPGFMKGHKAELALDIMNIGNMINKNWGLIDDYGFYSTARVANYAGIDPATGKYVYNFTGTTDTSEIQENNNDKGNTGVSRWSIQASFHYRF